MERRDTKQITIFENKELGSVRTIEVNGEPYFVGKEIAEILGYSNTRDALSKHVDEEDKAIVAIYDGIAGNPNKTVINESGLYSLIFSSKLPTAKKLKRWVTSEVLPAIHKHGMYLSESAENNLEKRCTTLEQTIEILQRTVNSLINRNNFKSSHHLEVWKNKVGKVLVSEISNKFGIDNQEAYKRIYSKMMTEFDFSINGAKAEFTETYNYEPVSILDAIAVNNSYCSWFEKSAEMLLGKDETVSLECNEK